MASGDLIHDATSLDFIRYLAGRPLADRSPGLFRFFARHLHNLTDLVGDGLAVTGLQSIQNTRKTQVAQLLR